MPAGNAYFTKPTLRALCKLDLQARAGASESEREFTQVEASEIFFSLSLSEKISAFVPTGDCFVSSDSTDVDHVINLTSFNTLSTTLSDSVILTVVAG